MLRQPFSIPLLWDKLGSTSVFDSLILPSPTFLLFFPVTEYNAEIINRVIDDDENEDIEDDVEEKGAYSVDTSVFRYLQDYVRFMASRR